MATIVNGADRGRPGKWLVDYRDHLQKRRWITCQSREEAKQRLAEVLQISPSRTGSKISADITLGTYISEHWVPTIASRKRRTREVYESVWRLHLAPTLAEMKIRAVEREDVRRLLSAKLRDGSSTSSVRLMMATLRAAMGQAVDDGVIQQNPATGHGKRFHLIESKAGKQERIKAMDAEQLTTFLTATKAEPRDARYADMFLLLARTGLRLGEALGLQWRDLDLRKGTLRVVRAFSKRHHETPKSGHGRTVDLSPELVTRLTSLMAADFLEDGGKMDDPVFTTSVGTNMDESKVRKAMDRVCALAGIGHFSPHDLRHTFASLHLQSGTSPAYVQRQLGHASITLTVDTYGKWLPSTDAASAAKLDALSPAERSARIVDRVLGGRGSSR